MYSRLQTITGLAIAAFDELCVCFFFGSLTAVSAFANRGARVELVITMGLCIYTQTRMHGANIQNVIKLERLPFGLCTRRLTKCCTLKLKRSQNCHNTLTWRF